MHGRVRKSILAALGAVGFAGWLTGCGTYSLLRPADTLKRGELEMTAGAAFNTLPEMTLVGQAAFGLADWLELGAQYEMYSALGQLRFGHVLVGFGDLLDQRKRRSQGRRLSLAWPVDRRAPGGARDGPARQRVVEQHLQSRSQVIPNKNP